MSRKILITNDDGINSDGIARLAAEAVKFGDVWVVAPDSQRSALSHSVTLRRGVDVWKADFPVPGVKAFACDGTPADCVRIGVLNIVSGTTDNIFSGINYGYNIASDIQYSATAGAAFEGAFRSITSVAFSEGADEEHSVTDRYLHEIMAELIEKPLGMNKIWNVNFPCCPLSECKGVLRDRIVSTDGFYRDRYLETKISEDRSTFTVDGIRNWEATDGTDLAAIIGSFVSVGIATNIT